MVMAGRMLWSGGPIGACRCSTTKSPGMHLPNDCQMPQEQVEAQGLSAHRLLALNFSRNLSFRMHSEQLEAIPELAMLLGVLSCEAA